MRPPNEKVPSQTRVKSATGQKPKATVEIERKFRLVSRPNSVRLGSGTEIIQGYILTEPTELRIRQKGKDFFLTVKGDGGLFRDEWETEIPETVFHALWPATGNRRLRKIRYRIPYSELMFEVDEYLDSLSGLYVLECEFSTPSAAISFVLPPWASEAIEITADPYFKISALLQRA
jgi:adenylate cyclase